MLATPHMITGAAIGKMTRRLWIALPLAFVSHFALDFIPHLDSHGLFGVKGGGPTPAEAGMAALDTVFGIALVMWAVGRQPGRRTMLLAALCAAVIDLADNVPPWGPHFQAWPGTAWLSAFHHGHSHGLAADHWLLGLGTQIAVMVLALWIVLAWKPPGPRFRSFRKPAEYTG